MNESSVLVTFEVILKTEKKIFLRLVVLIRSNIYFLTQKVFYFF